MTQFDFENPVNIIANANKKYSADEIDEACSVLYNTLKKRTLKKVAYDYCRGDISLAEDAFQDAMIKLLSSIKQGKIKNPNGLSKWIRTACRFYVLSWFKYTSDNSKNDESGKAETTSNKAIEEVVCFSQLSDEEGRSCSEYIESFPDTEHIYFDPSRYTYANQALDQVHSVIKKAILNSDQRTVFRMCVLQDMKMKEVADILNMNENTVKSNLRYARKAIETFRKNSCYDPYNYIRDTGSLS